MSSIYECLKDYCDGEKKQGLEGFKQATWERFRDTNLLPGFELDDFLLDQIDTLKILIENAKNKEEVIEAYLEVEKCLITDISDFYHSPEE